MGTLLTILALGALVSIGLDPQLRADWREYTLDEKDAKRLHRHLNARDDDSQDPR